MLRILSKSGSAYFTRFTLPGRFGMNPAMGSPTSVIATDLGVLCGHPRCDPDAGALPVRQRGGPGEPTASRT